MKIEIDLDNRELVLVLGGLALIGSTRVPGVLERCRIVAEKFQYAELFDTMKVQADEMIDGGLKKIATMPVPKSLFDKT